MQLTEARLIRWQHPVLVKNALHIILLVVLDAVATLDHVSTMAATFDHRSRLIQVQMAFHVVVLNVVSGPDPVLQVRVLH